MPAAVIAAARRSLTSRGAGSNGGRSSNGSAPRSSNSSNDGNNNGGNEQARDDIIAQANPYVKTFLTAYKLSPQGQRVLRDMVTSYERISPMADLESREIEDRDMTEELDEFASRKRRITRRNEASGTQESANVWSVSFAPLHQVYTFGFGIMNGERSGQNEQKVVELLKETKSQVTKLAEDRVKAIKREKVINLAAKFFYSYAVADYGAGEGADLLEKAAMAYLTKHPEALGANGKELMSPTNVDSQKAIKSMLRDKWTNLRSYFKDEIHNSMGTEPGTKVQTAYELLEHLVDSYQVPVTERMLQRIVLVRWCIREYQVRFPPQDEQEDESQAQGRKKQRRRWPINDEFWRQANDFIREAVRSYNDPVDRADIVDFYEQAAVADRNDYGDWTFKDNASVVTEELKFNKFIKQAYPDSLKNVNGNENDNDEPILGADADHDQE